MSRLHGAVAAKRLNAAAATNEWYNHAGLIMSLARKINELLTRDDALAERRGIWGAILRFTSPSLAGLKILLAITALANVLAAGGALGETAGQVSAAIASKIGRGAAPEATVIALAVTVLLHDGGTRAMSIAQKALKFAIRPLLNERHQTGFHEGRVENQKEWEKWLERRRDAGIAWPDDDPPPGASSDE